MRASSAIKRAVFAVVSLAVVSVGMVATGGSASATSYPTYCNGSLCATVVAISGNEATIRETTSVDFYGHFDLQTPNHQLLHSGKDIAYNPGQFHTFYSVNGGVGTWCATQYGWNGQYYKMGYVCFPA
jgi:hypothetical protein